MYVLKIRQFIGDLMIHNLALNVICMSETKTLKKRKLGRFTRFAQSFIAFCKYLMFPQCIAISKL